MIGIVLIETFIDVSLKIEWDLTTGPLSKLLELARARAIRYSSLGVHSVGPVRDFLEMCYFVVDRPYSFFVLLLKCMSLMIWFISIRDCGVRSMF